MFSAAFRSRKAAKASKQEIARREVDKERAVLLIQSFVRMWQTQAKYQKLLEFRSQKEIQLSFFTQQVNIL